MKELVNGAAVAWRGSGDDRRENAFRCWDHTDCSSLTNRRPRNDLFSRETRRDRKKERKKERKKISHELLETLSRDDHLSSRRRAHHSHPIDISFHVDYNEISRIIERRNWMLIFFSFRRNFNCNSGRISLSPVRSSFWIHGDIFPDRLSASRWWPTALIWHCQPPVNISMERRTKKSHRPTYESVSVGLGWGSRKE